MIQSVAFQYNYNLLQCYNLRVEARLMLQFVAFQYNNKLLQKCTILHEGLCQWPLLKPQDNGKAQSNMTKQSARSVPKIEKHELQMVTKCTKWAQNSNTNVEQIRLRINRTHLLCEIFTTRSYVTTCGWRYKEIHRYENKKSSRHYV